MTFRDFGTGRRGDRQDALAWALDGAGLWSVEQKVMQPSGFASSGLMPILISRDGDVRRFAPPKHAAGPLDALAWGGADGRAIAQFGTRGHRYRPEHTDPSPTLAMIDVEHGQILDTLDAKDAEALKLRAEAYNGFSSFDISAVQSPDGRLHALLQFQRVLAPSRGPAPSSGPAPRHYLPAAWLLWTQGQKPVPLTPFSKDRFAHAVLTPDGSHILAWRPLQPAGADIVAECYANCPVRPKPKPVEAILAALIDGKDGQKVWSLKARADEHWTASRGPTVSPDGRHALIPLPSVDKRQILALLSMEDGRILQRFSLACSGCYPQSFGFTRGGRQMWIGVTNRLAFYDLR
ncbi:hypothetical protein [Novosphingobium profundi]|uniref:hypothetical protein n=1 Tax=Novosphingobium profundi TaxID=1774954 RepID=UPI001CFD4267|nr:hypothetical protein [Novosphingobium profundi]